MKDHRLGIVFCVFLVISIIPVIKGQNSGPNAPEAMQFEPVDATDMVNLFTGDVSYVLPLLTVPNPEGGYPIVLNYHAGITMDQEASWVGLGWNLNVGSINRSVMGIADDINGSQSFVTYYDYLGQDINNSIGVSVPFSGITVGLNVAWGSSWSVGGFVGLKNGVGFGMNVGSDGFGGSVGFMDKTTGRGASFSVGPQGGSLTVNNGTAYASLGTNRANVGISTYIPYSNIPLSSMGVSFDSKGVGLNGSIGGIPTVASFSNTNGNTYSLYSDWNVDLLFIRFGHMHAKHFIFQKEVKNDFGILYHYKSMLNSNEEYHIDGVQSLKNTADVLIYPFNSIDYSNNDLVECNSQLMLPAYDAYNVSAQGISGNLSPRFFKPGLIYGNGRTITTGYPNMDYSYDEDGNYLASHRNIKDEIHYLNALEDLPKISDITTNIYYYFNNVSESYLKIREGSFSYIAGDIIYSGGQLESSDNYNSQKHRKVNSNFVEYFTNREIKSNLTSAIDRGFIEIDNIQRNDTNMFVPGGIGAFSIVSADGKTYHYSLPVYQFETFVTKDLPNSGYFETISNSKYAYAWLLTSITGPDFVDRPNNGVLGTVGEEDYGYWVKFEYGKWTDGYIWQLPYLKKPNEAYTWGRKQVYYLNAVKTRTHTAYFIKSVRKDGLGVQKYLPETSAYEYKNKKLRTFTYVDCNGVSHGDMYNCTFQDLILKREINCNYEHQILKLDKIVLVKNDDNILTNTNVIDLIINAPLNGSIRYQEYITFKDYNEGVYGTYCKKPLIQNNFGIYYQDNILDCKDNEGVNIEAKALEIIDFKYDYSLAVNSPNSSNDVNNGKLTLLSVMNRGAGGSAAIPPYRFVYNMKQTYSSNYMDDWGFNYIYSDNWSLKEIVTPINSKIKIEYESDSYYKETTTNQDPYYVFNGYDLDHTIVNKSESGVTIEVEFPFPQYVTQEFLENITSTVGYADFDVDYIKLPPLKVKQVQERLRDVPVTIVSSGGYPKFRFNYYNELMSDWECVIKKISLAVKVFKPGPINAGGLRAKRITINDGIKDKISTEYYYYKPGTTNTSGVITYSPSHGLYIPYIYEQLTPGVFYEYVTIKNKAEDGSYDGETIYNFEIPAIASNPNSLEYTTGSQLIVDDIQSEMADDPFIPTTILDVTSHARSTLIKNSNSTVGRLISIQSLNNSNELISEVRYNYKPISNTLPGSVQESFFYLKGYTQWGYNHETKKRLYQYVSTSKVEYPSILDNVVSVSNGLKTITYYDSYDINTGKATSIRTVMPDGKEYNSVVVPAYAISSYAGGIADDDSNVGIGSKVWNIYNKNMLSQEAASINLLNINTSASPIWKVIGTGIQTWKSSWDNNGDEDAGTGAGDQTGVWRKYKTFAWKGNINSDGTYNSSYFNAGGRYSPENIASYWGDFEGEGVNGWQKTSEIITYNKYSLPIQARDINNNYSSTKTDLTDALVIASAAYARYNEFAFAGAEESVASGSFFGGNVKNAGGSVNSTYKHTGKNSLSVSSGNKGFSFVLTPRSRTYKVSVWVKGTSADYGKVQLGYNGSTILPATNYHYFQAGDWFLVTGTVALGTSTSELFCKANGAALYFDDFRVQPVDATVTAYVYDERDNVSAILGNDNLAVKYEYDEGDRLIATYKETPKGFEKVSGNDYNFSRCSCTAGFSWTPVTLTANNRNVSFAPFDNSNNCTYNWSFGDGTANSTLKNPTHTFSVPGSTSNGYYNVSCTVTDSKGKTATETNMVYFAFAKIASPNAGTIITKGTTTMSIYTTLPGSYAVEQFKVNEYHNRLSMYAFTTTQYGTTTIIPTNWMSLSDSPYNTCIIISFSNMEYKSEYFCGYNVVN